VRPLHLLALSLAVSALAACGASSAPAATPPSASSAMPSMDMGGATADGSKLPAGAAATGPPAAGTIPPLIDPHDIYAAGRPGLLAPEAKRARSLVYVPNGEDGTVSVIDQATYKVIQVVKTGRVPQHVTPSYDLKTLWVSNNTGNSVTPINPRTGAFGRNIPVDDPYNVYFTADGTSAIIVAEALRRLDFRDPHTMKLQQSLQVPCPGVDHMDFSADGTHALASCEFSAKMIWLDIVHRRVIKELPLRQGAMPQDVKLSPDGKTYYVADMMGNGVYLIDAATIKVITFLPTGREAHGLYPSRDSKTLYISNRRDSSVSLLNFATRSLVGKWRIPGNATPDMGGVNADGTILWLSGRYSGEVYAIDTRTGALRARIRVGRGPHGLSVWPQPGRYSLGHTGILR
jgi:YVTN family beta-propeller protein